MVKANGTFDAQLRLFERDSGREVHGSSWGMSWLRYVTHWFTAQRSPFKPVLMTLFGPAPCAL